LIAVQAGYDLAGELRLISEPDDPKDSSKTADLHPGILSLAESHQVLDPSTDLEVTIRGEAYASRTDVEGVSRAGDAFSTELSNLYR